MRIKVNNHVNVNSKVKVIIKDRINVEVKICIQNKSLSPGKCEDSGSGIVVKNKNINRLKVNQLPSHCFVILIQNLCLYILISFGGKLTLRLELTLL